MSATDDRIFTHDDAQSLLTKQTDIKDSIDALKTAVNGLHFPASVGSAKKPVYTNANGVLTASDATVGSGTKPVFLNAGEITASGSTVGGKNGTLDEPMYLDNGTLLKCGAYVPVQDNAGHHNSIYRGKNLGNALTAAQSEAIQNGKFTDMFPGDFWQKTLSFTYYSAATDATAVSGKTYYADTAGTALPSQPSAGTDISNAGYCVANNVNASFKIEIADFNYYYNIGDAAFTTNHIVVVPSTCFYNAQMHITNTGGYVSGSAANTTEGGYIATDLFKGLVAAENAFISMFGSTHIPSHKVLVPTTCTGGKYTSWGWQSRKVDILTEQQVYGARAWGAPANNGYSVASQKTQLSLFKLHPQAINTRQTYWLQDVYSAADFCYVYGYGFAGSSYASSSRGVRPLSLVI